MFEDYNKTIIISTWGLPKNYREVYYVLEIITKNGGMDCVPRSKDIKKSSSTAAIKEILERKLNVKNIELLIFVQDTILLDEIRKNSSMYRGKDFSRKSLKDKLFVALYNSNITVARELGVNDPNAYRNIVRFVPGTLSYVEGLRLYTWRGKRIYDVLRGILMLYIYSKLKELGDPERIAIVLDTTHGINYFVLALKEATMLATELFVLDNIPKIKVLDIYHYNSDPITPDSREGKPSLKLHLLDKIRIIKDNKLYTSYITSILRESEAIYGKNGALNNFWRGTNWVTILDTLSLYSKGLLVWSLRAVMDDYKIPAINQLEEAAESIKIKIRQQDSSMTISYDWGARRPIVYIVVLSIFFEILRKYANDAKVNIEIMKEAYKYISAILSSLSDIEEDRLNEIKQLITSIRELLQAEDKFICYDINEVINLAERILMEPLREINVHELKDRILDYLKGCKVPRWKEILNCEGLKIYREAFDRAYLVINNDVSLLISLLCSSIERRNIYAHAGLAYGLEWLAINLKRSNKSLLCLRDVEHLKRIVKR